MRDDATTGAGRLVGALAALALATAAVGCGSQQRDTPSAATPQVRSEYAGMPLRGTPGELVYEQSGCAACHRIGPVGNSEPGRRLTHVGSRLTAREIRHALVEPVAPMPLFRLPPAKMRALVAYLSRLR